MPSASGCLTARRECHPSSPSFSLPSRVQAPRPETRNLQVGVAKRLPTPHHPPGSFGIEVWRFALPDSGEGHRAEEHRPQRNGSERWGTGEGR